MSNSSVAHHGQETSRKERGKALFEADADEIRYDAKHGVWLFTSWWGNTELGSLDAQMVAISRGRPRKKLPFRYRVLSDLAPSREAFGIEDPVQFERVYRSGLEEIGLERILEALKRIRRDSGGRALVLLCWEAPGKPCHRHVLSAWLREQGIEINELQEGYQGYHLQEGAALELRLF